MHLYPLQSAQHSIWYQVMTMFQMKLLTKSVFTMISEVQDTLEDQCEDQFRLR